MVVTLDTKNSVRIRWNFTNLVNGGQLYILRGGGGGGGRGVDSECAVEGAGMGDGGH